MTNLIRGGNSSALALNDDMVHDPFKVIFEMDIRGRDFSEFQSRVDFLDDFVRRLTKMTTVIADEKDANHWRIIAASFGSFMSISAYISLANPVTGVVAAVAVIAALAGGGEHVTRNQKVGPIIGELDGHNAAMASKPPLAWASLWHYCCEAYPEKGNDVFRLALFAASRGRVVNGEMVRTDGSSDNPFSAGLRSVAKRFAMNVDDLADDIEVTIATFKSGRKVVSSLPQKALTLSAQDTVNVPVTEIQTPTVTVTAEEIQPIAVVVPSFTSPNLTPPKNRSELIARLKQDCPLLLKLVKSHPIRAVGVQRSGKTTLVKRLALLRMALMENHRVVASSPHYEEANPYPEVFDVVGIRHGKRDYPAIERAWYQMAGDVEACNMANITYVWDEFGLQDKAIPITPENDPIKTVLTSCLRETMKFQIYPIFILHGETAAFLPGSKGLVTVILASTVRVETIGESVEGDDGLEMIRPTGRFNVTWLDGSKGEGILPAWLSEDFLLEMIGPRSNPVVKTSDTALTPVATIARLENAYQSPAVEVEGLASPDTKPDGLTEFTLVEKIWDYLNGKEPRTLKQVSDAMSAKGKISDDELRESLGDFRTYKDAINTVMLFGIGKRFLVQSSEGSFEAVQKH